MKNHLNNISRYCLVIVIAVVFCILITRPSSSQNLHLGLCNNADCTDRWVSNENNAGDGTLHAVLWDACHSKGDDIIQFSIWKEIHINSPIVIPADCDGSISIVGRTNIRTVIDGSNIALDGELSERSAIAIEGNGHTIENITIVGVKNEPQSRELLPGIGISVLGSNNTLRIIHSGIITEDEEDRGNDIGIYIDGDNNTIKNSHISRNTLDGISVSGDVNIIQGNYIGEARENCELSPRMLSPNNNDNNLVAQGDSSVERGDTGLLSPELSESDAQPNAVESAAAGGGCQLLPATIHKLQPLLPLNAATIKDSLMGLGYSDTKLSNLLAGVSDSGCQLQSNGGNGIHLINNTFHTIIGGLNDGERNIIQYNGGAGVRADEDGLAYRNTIQGNLFFRNRGLGIDLGAEGVSPSDGEDNGLGPDGIHNSPDNLSVWMREYRDGVRNAYNFTLTGEAKVGDQIEVYLVDGATERQDLALMGDESGHGEGEFLLTRFQVEESPFTVVLPEVARGTKISLLSTDGDGNTSEFSENVILDKDSDGDGIVDMIEDQDRDEVVDTGESDPYEIDTDGDGLIDSVEDRNLNGKYNEVETKSFLFDSDDDGLSDLIETRGDGIYNQDIGDTDPMNPDTDGDGMIDGDEDTNSNGIWEFRLGEHDPRSADAVPR